MEKYLRLLSKKYPTIDSAASEIINLSAIRSLPKGTEYYFSDLHGEYESFLHMLKSASGVIRKKLDLVFSKTLSNAQREKLATLIYYPKEEMKRYSDEGQIDSEWLKLTIYRLILLCESVSAKYTRSKVRKRIPKDLQYIFDELLNVTDDVCKDFYYEEIIRTILDTGIAENFIITLCQVIQSLALDKLHIIGDIFDRGPRADIIMDELLTLHDVDIQWGNHDISWIGAAAGNQTLIANVIRIAMRYNNFDILEDGYGLNLRALAVFAGKAYKEDECRLFHPNTFDDNIYDPVDADLVAKMHKAITIIQLKLEGQLITAHPEWNMSQRNVFANTDFVNFTVRIDGKIHELKSRYFPTVSPESPLELSQGEKELMLVLTNSFLHSEKLQKHIKFLIAHGSMYKLCNENLMFHGCIPMNSDGGYMSLNIDGIEFSGKSLMDKTDSLVHTAYYGAGEEKKYACDFMWYLWCGERSPLYGKNKMTFFERIFLDDKSLHIETYNDYYTFSERRETCEQIMSEFGMDVRKGHIINGHVPVKIKDGESPVKAGGKLFVIDGGIAKAYQQTTGIAGYTLIYDSHTLSLAEHKPFINGRCDNTPTVRIVEKMEHRMNVADTDNGQRILDEIDDLRRLLDAYKCGKIKQG
ncbi:MAG: fructose-1,6-bisphosphatase [Oscillospiraceae bacterium]|nr:fructose-1,6-bisphosphatase [Oscillospiraceae bacterium]